MASESSSTKTAPLATPCECGHTRNFHLDGRRMFPCTVGRCDCGNFKKRELDPECKCRHPLTKHGADGVCAGCKSEDLGILSRHNFIGPLPEEPPLTPEEEEEAPEDKDKAICGRCHTDHARGSCEPAEAPPQPERRPPYAVDYSAGGHAFQVLVPGDAAVLAVDGALIIRHADFPVLGISCITPLKTEAS